MSVSPSGLITHCSYPNENEECLIVPLEKRFRQIGLSFFLPLRKRTALKLKSLQTIYGTKVKRLFRETKLMDEIKHLAGDSSLKTVVSIGTPGPYSKNTVLMLKDDGTPVSVAKIGATPKAVHQIKREAQWLKLLTAEPRMIGWTPRFIAEAQLDDVYVLIQSVCAGSFAGKRLLPVHLKFLSLFQNIFQENKSFHASLMRREINRRFELLKSKLSPEWIHRIQTAMHVLDVGLANGPTLTVAAHRDFAPWNMRVIGGGLCLFDWEYASNDYLPLYDLFHFFILPLATQTAISEKRIGGILSKVRRCAEVLEDSHRKLEAQELQLLAYLVDVSLFYLESNDGQHVGDKVVHCFGGLIDAFDAWSA